MTPDASSSQTPGHLAYEAWFHRRYAGDPLRLRQFPPFADLQTITQQSWEAAAQAVLALKTDEVHTAPVATLHALADATPERDTAAITTTEKACRWTLVLAFWEWQLAQNVRPLPRVAWYARALGLEPTEVFHDDA